MPTAPSQAFCDLARASAEDLRQISVSLTEPDRLRPLLDEATARLDQSAPIAPKDAQGFVGLLRAATADLRAALKAADYQLAKLPPPLAMKLMTPDVVGGRRGLETYVERAC